LSVADWTQMFVGEALTPSITKVFPFSICIVTFVKEGPWIKYGGWPALGKMPMAAKTNHEAMAHNMLTHILQPAYRPFRRLLKPLEIEGMVVERGTTGSAPAATE
jgi:hypothetical protein